MNKWNREARNTPVAAQVFEARQIFVCSISLRSFSHVAINTL
jgi:hypothetical protein